METGMTVAYELIRSKRRTIAIVIDSKGKCRVRAPLQARLSDIEHFVQAKTGWIEQKQQHYAAVQKKRQLILTDGMQLSVFVEITAKQQNNAVADKLHRKYNRYL